MINCKMCFPPLTFNKKRCMKIHLALFHGNRSDEYLELHKYRPKGLRKIDPGYGLGVKTIQKAANLVKSKVKHIV